MVRAKLLYIMHLLVIMLVGLTCFGCAGTSDTTGLVEWAKAERAGRSLAIWGESQLKAGTWAALEIRGGAVTEMPTLPLDAIKASFRVVVDTEAPVQAGTLKLRVLPLDAGTASVAAFFVGTGADRLEIPGFSRPVASNFEANAKPEIEAIVPDLAPQATPWWPFAVGGVVLAGLGFLFWYKKLRTPKEKPPIPVNFPAALQALLDRHQTADELRASEAFLAAETLLQSRFPAGLSDETVLDGRPALRAYMAGLEQEKFWPNKLTLDEQRELLAGLAPLMEDA